MEYESFLWKNPGVILCTYALSVLTPPPCLEKEIFKAIRERETLHKEERGCKLCIMRGKGVGRGYGGVGKDRG